jgi:hypothetical protein
MTFSAKLDAVSKAKQAYVIARTTLEARLREQMRSELSNLQTQIDIAVRYAVDAGERKAAVMRALGTKDYNTLKQSLERTQGVSEVVGADPLATTYFHTVDDEGVETLEVRYDHHGTLEYSGYASFTIKRLDNGNILFLSDSPLWNDDYTIRNDVVVALDGKTDGEYYVEAVDWIRKS